MKLLFLTEFFPQDKKLVFTGGVEARVYYIVQQAKKDYQVQVISSRSKQVPATPFSVFSRISYLFSSFNQALRSDFDLIEASNVVTYLPAWLAAKLKRKPVIAWIPDVLGKHWFEFSFFVAVFGFVLEKISLVLPWTHVIALSQSTKNKLIKRGLNPKKISVARAGINPQEFKIKSQKKFPKFTVISIARLVNTKKLDQLIRAFTQIKQAKLMIIGQGPRKSALQKLINQLNLKSKITIKSNLSRQQLISHLNQSHLFCLPSIVEGFGIATIEAMICGLPAVLTNIAINREITKNGQGAVFFKPNDINSLAGKINLMVNNHQLYQQKQVQALKLAPQYTWGKIYKQTKKIYETCLSY